MLFAAWPDNPFRPTGDLDLLGFGDDEVALIADTFRAICTIELSDDGVLFDVDGLRAAAIPESTDYAAYVFEPAPQSAMRGCRSRSTLASAMQSRVTVEIEYPTLLDGPAPHLRAYPAETVVAEKFQALVILGLANTRMKDFYNLWLISRTFGFEDAGLAKAVRRTFERRRTSVPFDVPTGLSDTFVHEKAGQWRAFLRRERLVVAPDALDQLVGDPPDLSAAGAG